MMSKGLHGMDDTMEDVDKGAKHDSGSNRRVHLKGWECQSPRLDRWEIDLLEVPFSE